MSQQGPTTKSQLNKDGTERQKSTLSLPVISRRVRCLICNQLEARQQMIQCISCRKWMHFDCCDVDLDGVTSFDSHQCRNCREPIENLTSSQTVQPTTMQSTTVQTPSIQQSLTAKSIATNTTSSYQTVRSDSPSRLSNVKTSSHVEPDVVVNKRSSKVSHSTSSSRLRSAAALELQRIEAEKLLMEEKRLRKEQIQRRIMEELVKQQLEIENQFQEDKNYLDKKVHQQVLLEDYHSHMSGASSLSSSNVVKRTFDWVNEGNRQQRLYKIPETKYENKGFIPKSDREEQNQNTSGFQNANTPPKGFQDRNTPVFFDFM